MLKKLIRFSLDNALLVLVLAGVLIAFAAFQLPRTPSARILRRSGGIFSCSCTRRGLGRLSSSPDRL